MSSTPNARPITQAEEHLVNEVYGATQPINGWDSARSFDQQIIRAAFLRALLCGQVQAPDKNGCIDNIVSLHLINSLIVGHLDLNKCKELPHIRLEDSVITGGIALRSATTGCVHLSRCYILQRGIDASGLRSSGAIQLEQLQFAHRAVLDFSQANIECGCTLSSLSTHAPEGATKILRDELKDLVTKLTAPTQPAVAADPKFAHVHSLQKLVSDTWSAAASSCSNQLGDFAFLSLKAAHINGDLIIEGLRISTCNHRCRADGCCDKAEDHGDDAKLAIDAERVDVKGDVSIVSNASQRSVMRGGINFSFAQIAGHLSITGIGVFCCADENALNCEGAVIGGHFGIRPFDGTRTRLRGSLRILGAHIKGQLILHSVILYAATAITGDGVTIDNDFFVRPAGADAMQISVLCGRVRLPGATIGGQFNLHGTRVMICACPAPANATFQQSAAAPAVAMTAPAHPAPARLNPPNPGHEAVMSMRDVTIKGGLFFVPSRKHMTCILGGVRLNDSTVNGVFEVIGTRITAAPNGTAIDATGATIKSDFLLAGIHPERRSDTCCQECLIEGTIRIMGLTLGGRLSMEGVSLHSQLQESALLASGASIKGGIFIQSARIPQTGTFLPSHIVGALRMNHAQVGSRFQVRGATIEASQFHEGVAVMANGAHFAGDVTFGDNLAAGEQTSPAAESETCKVIGEIRLYGTEIKGGLKFYGGAFDASPQGTGFAIDGYNSEIAKGVLLTSAGGLAQSTLNIHGIVGFAYATLGSFILGGASRTSSGNPIGHIVSLQGHIRLSGAEMVDLTALQRVRVTPPDVTTKEGKDLADQIYKTLNRWDRTGREAILCAQNADLGTMLSMRLDPTSHGFIDLLGAKVYTLDDHDDDRGHGVLGWGDSPKFVGSPPGVCLGLLGFTYTHLMTDEYDSVVTSGHRTERLVRRTKWLQQQYVDGKITAETYSPLPYIQLASVFRAQGFNREADDISFDRRNNLVKHGTMRPFDKFLQWCYGRFFGFGYRPARASAACLALFLFNLAFAYVGTWHKSLEDRQPQPWLIEADHPSSGPSLLHLDFSSGAGAVHAATVSAVPSSPPILPQPVAPSPNSALLEAPCISKKSKRHQTRLPLPPPAKQITSAAGQITTNSAPDRACRKPWIYAIDQTLPLIHVTSGNGCEVLRDAPKPYYGWHIAMLFLGWIVIPTAALTFSGILRETNK
jgi:hypothetical protein